MDALFWERLHGGSTHLPIVLLPVSVMIDFVATRVREESSRRALHRVGLALAWLGVLGGCGAVVAGLRMTGGQMLGSGVERLHHLFVWPAFGISIAFAILRLAKRRRPSARFLHLYLAAMSAASVLMLGAGYWGGELLLRENAAGVSVAPSDPPTIAARGHELFLMNCAHCHGADARGTDEGPNLTTFRKSDARIASVVKRGIKGEMPRFDQKLSDDDVKELIRFIRSVSGAT